MLFLVVRHAALSRSALELKGQYLGQTGPRVQNAVADAMGGCLFLDEAYALAGSQAGGDRHGDHYGGEAVRTLLTEVENNRTGFLCILAGYQAPMEKLLRMDPGLPRRFATRIHLEDYNAAELAEICRLTAEREFGLTFEEDLKQELELHLQINYKAEIAAQNAGLSVNLTEKAARALARRAGRAASADPTNPVPDLNMLVREDYGIARDVD